MEYCSAIKMNENFAICSNMDGPRGYDTNEARQKEKLLHDNPYMWNLKRNDTNELTYKTEPDSQT